MSRHGNGTPDVCYNIVLPMGSAADFSIGCWARCDNTGSAEQICFGYGKTAATAAGAFLETLGGTWQALSGGIGRDNSTVAVVPFQWVHLVATFTAAGASTLYVNGVNKASSAGKANSPSAGGISALAGVSATTPTFSLYFPGSVAKCGIWSMVLAGSDVTNLSGGSNPLTVQSGNLVFYCPLCGITVPESDPVKHNDLTVTGATRSDNPPLAFSDCEVYLEEVGMSFTGSPGRWW